MDPLKEAFSKIKEDITFLKKEVSELKDSIYNLSKEGECRGQEYQTDRQQENQKEINRLDGEHHFSPENKASEGFSGIKSKNSIGNRGVSTDRQTDRQTDIQTKNGERIRSEDGAEVLFKLNKIRDNTKKMVQSLTSQELAVLCKIYELEEVNEPVTYAVLAKRLGLTESSMRDYITRLLKKDAPLEKRKRNNKQVEISLIKDTKILIQLHTLNHLRNEDNRYNE